MTNEISFDIWCIALFDSLKSKNYTAIQEDIDILPGMYNCGMTAKEAAETLTASDARLITPHQLNMIMFGKTAAKFLEAGTQVLFIIGKSAKDKFDFVSGYNIDPEEFFEATAQVGEMLKDMLSKKRKPEDL